MKAKGPQEALKQFGNEPNLRVVACGGDGTIRWVIGGVIEAKLPTLPIMGGMPANLNLHSSFCPRFF